MSNCGTIVAFAGRSDFNSLMSEVIGVSLIKKGNTFTDATFIQSANWHTKIADLSAGMVALPLSIKRGFENTTPEVAFETATSTGFQEQTTQPVPSLKGYVDGSYCDYKQLMALNGHSFEVVLHLKDGTIFATRNDALVVRGFKATVNTYFGIPLAENRMQSYPLWINFEYLDEFQGGYIDNPDWTFRALLDFIPVGLSAKVTTRLTTTAVIKVVNRATGAGYEGLVVGDFTVLSSSSDAVTVSVCVDDGSGQYTITVIEDTGGAPSALDSGEWAIVQATNDDATYITYVTNPLKLSVA